MNEVCVGDYVISTKYYDGDPQDQWCVGFYHSEIDYGNCGKRFQVVDENGNQFRGNGFRRIKKISKKRGEWLLENAKIIEGSGRSVWYWVRAKMSNLKSAEVE